MLPDNWDLFKEEVPVLREKRMVLTMPGQEQTRHTGRPLQVALLGVLAGL